MAWSITVVGVVAFAAGMAIGAGGHAWYAGTYVSASDASELAQSAVKVGVQADREIVSAETETQTAVERVRVVTRTVEVAAQCPPGAGAVSDAFAAELHALAAKRAAAGGD